MARFAEISAILIVALYRIDLSCGETWDTLHMRWTPVKIPVLDQRSFAKMPLTSKEAEDQNYVAMEKSDLFKGTRYIKDGDVTNILIYDIDNGGRLVGIQSQFPESKMTKKTGWTEWFKREVMFVREKHGKDTIYILTAYTVNPDSIGKKIDCNKKVGCGLWFLQRKDEENTKKYLKVPLTTNEAKGIWKKEKCVFRMGVHHFYNTSIDMDCKYMRPFILMFIDGKLSGFVWLTLSHFDHSKRLEHPPKSILRFFFHHVPKCLPKVHEENNGFNSIHFFFNDHPRLFICYGQD